MVFNLMRQGKFPIRTAIRAGVWGLKYKAGIAKDSVDVRQGIFRVFKDMPAEETDRLITRVYRRNIATKAREQAIERIAWHQVHGDLVILTSASFEVIARLFAEDVGAYAQVSTRMVVENGSYTGEIEGAPVEGPEKVRRLTEFADAEFGAGNWKVSYSYGDHDSDEDILSIAEHPVAVSPKRKLEAIAIERGWEIQEWE
jgi:HAD superfamily hydrolase (TIGR01490 family)